MLQRENKSNTVKRLKFLFSQTIKKFLMLSYTNKDIKIQLELIKACAPII